MAKNTKDKANDIFRTPVSSAAEKQLTDAFNKSNIDIAKHQDNLDSHEIGIQASSSSIAKDVNANINKLFSAMLSSTAGEVSSSDVDNMILLSSKNAKKTDSLSKQKLKKAKKDIDAIKTEILNKNHQEVSNLLTLHKKRFLNSLATYNTIIRIIPKMRLILNTVANSIISPDDFTKRSIRPDFDKSGINDEDAKDVKDRLEGIVKDYLIDDNIKEDVLSYLINGKLYYLVLSMNQQIKTLLTESGDEVTSLYKTIDSKDSLLESVNVQLNNSNVNDINGLSTPEKMLVENFSEAFGVKVNKENFSSITKGISAVNEIIKNEFVIGTSLCLAQDQENILTEDAMSGFASFVKSASAASSSPLTDKENSIIDSTNDNAIVKRVSPGNIIPLEFDNNILGYIYLDIIELDDDNTVLPKDVNREVEADSIINAPSGAAGNGNILQNMVISKRDVNLDGNNNQNSLNKNNAENPDGTKLNPIEDYRLKFLADTFVNKLSKETNIKLLKKNEALKFAIYNGLCLKKLNSNQKVRVVYLKPEEVVYINRKASIFDNVLFFCNLYIATLITILMQNVMNKTEQRVVYVEVGNDNNAEGSVNQVVQNIKSKEISQAHNMDLQSILNTVGSDNTFYIPVIDGEKPISFDTIENSNNKNLDDEFLTWLGNNIFTGMGIPSAYLTEVENIDFAKTLSMQNSRYLRDILGEQSILSKGYTELFQKIYRLKYSAKDKARKKTDSSEVYFNSDAIYLHLPAPAALMLTNLNDQLQNASNLIDTIVQTTDLKSIPDEEADKVKNIIKSQLIRKYVTSFDWDELDGLVGQTISDYIAAKTEGQLDKVEDTTGLDKPETDDTEGEGTASAASDELSNNTDLDEM